METIVKNAGMKLLKQPRQPLPLLNLLAIMTCTMREHLKQSYEHVWTAPDNKEIILANKKYRNFTTSSHPITSNIPAWAGSSWSDGGLFTTFNFVRFYEGKKTGTNNMEYGWWR